MKSRAKIMPLTGRPAGRSVRRVQDWPSLLYHFIEARRHQPFAWGRQDCCLFASDGILAQTGFDPAAKSFRGKYRDALGAARLVRKHGGVEAIAVKAYAELGYPAVPVLMAQRGDVMATDQVQGEGAGMGLALGIAIGDGLAAFPGPEGLLFLPVGQCVKAWRVG